MTWVALSVVAFWGYCGLMSVLCKGERPLLQNSLFQVASVALYVALASACAGAFFQVGHPCVTIPGFALVAIFGVLLGSRYMGFLIGEWFDRTRGAATGIDQMKVEKTYDRAEKAEHEGRLEEALALYREEAARDPKDPEPLRRMGEILVRGGKIDEALVHFRAARPLLESAEGRTTLSFRTADVLARAGRPEEARQVLEEVLREFSGTRFEAYARERLDKLAPRAGA